MKAGLITLVALVVAACTSAPAPTSAPEPAATPTGNSSTPGALPIATAHPATPIATAYPIGSNSPTSSPTPVITPSRTHAPGATEPPSPLATSGPLTADNGLVVVWWSFFCPVGREAMVINKVLITAISHCPTKLPSSVLWSSDTPGQWNNSLQLDKVMAVGFANETYVGNDQNGSHPFADFANVYGRPSPIQPTPLPTQGDGATVSALAYVIGIGYLAVGVDAQPGSDAPQGVIWTGQGWEGGDWAQAPGPVEAASLIDAVPADHSFLVLGSRASDAAPVVWRFDAEGWSPGVELPNAIQSPDLQLIDEDTALDASHLWTGLWSGTPTVTTFPAGYSMRSVVHVPDGYIAVGEPDQGPAKDAILVSADGADWHLAAFNPDFARFRINVLVEASSRVIGLGGAEFAGPARVASYQLQ